MDGEKEQDSRISEVEYPEFGPESAKCDEGGREGGCVEGALMFKRKGNEMY